MRKHIYGQSSNGIGQVHESRALPPCPGRKLEYQPQVVLVVVDASRAVRLSPVATSGGRQSGAG